MNIVKRILPIAAVILVFGLTCNLRAEKSQNLLFNSTFRLCTTDRIPDYWGSDSRIMKDINTDVNWFETEDSSPVDGTRSIRFNKKNLFVQSYIHWLPSKKEYTFSVYLRSDKPGAKAKLHIGNIWVANPLRKEVELSADWKRYSFTAVPERGHWLGGALIVGVIGDDEGLTWMAAPQLEYGKEETPYRPSEFDEIIAKRLPAIETMHNIREGKSRLANIPEIRIGRLDKAPLIDGRIGDEWEKAVVIEGLKDAFTGDPAETQTTVYAAYDSDNLYVAFRCEEPDAEKMEKILNLKEKEERENWKKENTDLVSVIFAPDSSSELSFSFTVNIFGEISNDGGPFYHGWDYPFKVQSDGKGWSAELRIPFSFGNIFSPDGSVHMNFFRTRQNPRPVARRGDPWLTTYGLSSWSPTYGPCDTYVRYGVLKGFDGATEQYRYLIRNCRWIIREGKAFFAGDIQSCRTNPSTLNLSVRCHGSGKPDSQSVVDFKPGQTRRIYIPFGTTEDVHINWVEYALSDRDSGVCIQKVSRGAFKTPIDDSFRVIPEWDYYSNDRTARLIISSRTELPVSFGISLLDPSGDEVKSVLSGKVLEVLPGKKMYVSVDIASLREGIYRIVSTGKDRTGQEYSSEALLLKHLPGKNEVRINRLTGALYQNGKGFIPFSFSGGWDEDVEKHGFNCLMGFVPKGEYGKKLDEFSAKDKRVIVKVNPKAEGAEQIFNEIQNYPAVIANNWIDEPYGKTVEELLPVYELGKKMNPYQPLFINWGQEWSPGNGGGGTLKSTDIASLDYYPFSLWTQAAGLRGTGVVDIARWTERMKDDSRLMGRAMGFWNQIYGFDDAYRHPSPDEIHAMTYLCLINGVRLFYYFAGKPASLPLWERMADTAGELKNLESFILDTEAYEVTSGIMNYAVRYALWHTPKGFLLLTCNPLSIPVEGEFNLIESLGVRKRTAEVLFENRKMTFSGGILKDVFLPFERHVYNIN